MREAKSTHHIPCIRHKESGAYDESDLHSGKCQRKRQYCLPCRYPDKGNVRRIVEDILSSDYVGIASPSYWADVPGQLKTFFDRNTPYGDTNPNRVLKAEKAIKGIAIAVRAGIREQENEIILDAIQHYYGHLGIETVKRISVCETNTLEDLLNKHQAIIEQMLILGRQIALGY